MYSEIEICALMDEHLMDELEESICTLWHKHEQGEP